jgi:outer membrane protein assembly factor BamB
MRRAPAFWNILPQFGRRAGVVGWLVTWPAEPVDGFVVSAYLPFLYNGSASRPLKGTIVDGVPQQAHPPELIDEVSALKVALEDLDPALMARFYDPTRTEGLGRANLESIDGFRWSVACDETYRRIGLTLFDREQVDLFAVYFGGADVASHRFWKFANPEAMAYGVNDDEAAVLGRVIDAYYTHLDAMVGEYLERLDANDTLVILSDHGFKPVLMPRRPTASGHHRMEGIIAFWGRGIRRGGTIDDAGLLDVLPTLLTLLDVPLSMDLEGRVLEQAFDPAWALYHRPRFVDEYEVAGTPRGPDASEGPLFGAQLLRATATVWGSLPVFRQIPALLDSSPRRAPDQPAHNTAEADPAADTAEQAKLDRLRSLPYLSFTKAEEGEEADGVVSWDAERSYPGFNLYTSRKLRTAELIDAAGNLINSWSVENDRFWNRAVLLPSGELLVVGSENSELPAPHVSDEARYVMRFDWNGTVLWKQKLGVHHDIEVTPDNQLLVLGFKRRLITEMHRKAPTREDHLLLLDQQGQLLHMKSAYEALAKRPDIYQFQRIRPQTLGGTPLVDLLHLNAVEWMHREDLFERDAIYGPDNILVCSRHQDAIFIINWLTNEVVWAWGHGVLSGPHDAQVLPSGNIIVFDNGLRRGWSRVIELDPLTREIVWQYKAPDPTDFYTRGAGSAQRLPNGNTLISESNTGRAFEVTPDGQIVWEFRNARYSDKGERISIVRMIRYETDMIARILAEHRPQL